MTEEEKKDKIAAAKARLAKHAIIGAAVASVAAPAVSNAQTMSENVPQNTPEPIVQTVSAAPSSTFVTSPENAPAFGSDEWLENQTSADATRQSSEQPSSQISANDVSSMLNAGGNKFRQTLENLYSASDNFATTIRKDDLARTLAAVNNGLSQVQIYTKLKEKGITEIVDTENNAIPLEYLLEQTPGLSDIVGQEGFSLQNSENVREVIAVCLENGTAELDLSTLKNRPTILTVGKQNSEEFDQKLDDILKNFPMADKTIDLSKYSEELDAPSLESADKSADRQIANLQKQINTPCSKTTPAAIINAHTYIGGLADKNALTLSTPEANPDLTFNQPHHQLKRSDIVLEESSGIAYQQNGKIYINTALPSEEEKQKTQQRFAEQGLTQFNMDKEFANGSSIARMIVALHEACHLTQNKRAPTQDATDTPVITMKKNTLTEKTAFAVEFLAVSNLYASLKNKGVKMFSYTDKDGTKTVPLDYLLDLYPGLKEAAKDGFSPDKPEDVRKIVEASSKLWDERMAEVYKAQACRAAVGVLGRMPSFSAQLKLMKEKNSPEEKYEKDVKTMLTDIYIGGNISVNLNGCRDLLDTGNPEEIVNLGKPNEHPKARQLLSATLEDKKSQMIPEETLLKLDRYLINKGITGDAEKDSYVAEAYTAIITRSKDAKKYDDFKNILLENGGEIRYADGLIETHTPENRQTTYTTSHNYTIDQNALTTAANINQMALLNHMQSVKR